MCFDAGEAKHDCISWENKLFNWEIKDSEGEKPGKSSTERSLLDAILNTMEVQSLVIEEQSSKLEVVVALAL